MTDNYITMTIHYTITIHIILMTEKIFHLIITRTVGVHSIWTPLLSGHFRWSQRHRLCCSIIINYNNKRSHPTISHAKPDLPGAPPVTHVGFTILMLGEYAPSHALCFTGSPPSTDGWMD